LQVFFADLYADPFYLWIISKRVDLKEGFEDPIFIIRSSCQNYIADFKTPIVVFINMRSEA